MQRGNKHLGAVVSKSRRRSANVIPGFRLSLGFTIFYLSLIVLIPLSTVFVKTAGLTWDRFWQIVLDPRAVSSYQVTFGTSFAAGCVNAFFGLIVAWVLVRYRFPLRRFVDALVDLPFALPTAVAGITLSTLYSESGWIGSWFALYGVKISYTSLGITVALIFVGLPFVVRTLQPVIEDLEVEVEEAAACLGANRWQTFRLVIFPAILPALLTGFTMAFARAIGEYGSVLFIAGNIPMLSEITPLLIMGKLDQADYMGATAIAVVMLVISFVLLLGINGLQWWAQRRGVDS